MDSYVVRMKVVEGVNTTMRSSRSFRIVRSPETLTLSNKTRRNATKHFIVYLHIENRDRYPDYLR